MIPLLIGAGVLAAVALSDDDDDDELEETSTKRTLNEEDLPESVKEKLERKRRR